MSVAERRFVFVDATGLSLAALGVALRQVNAERATPIRVVSRGHADLADEARIADCVEAIRDADALVLLPHGGAESIPGFELMVEAARGKTIHVQTSCNSPESFALAQEFSRDFGGDAFVRRNDYITKGGVENFANLLRFMACDGGGALLPSPRDMPTEGIHHPDYSGPDDPDSYLSWARRRIGASPSAPVIGIWFLRDSWLTGDTVVIDAMITEIERLGAIALAVFHMRFIDADLKNLGVPALIDRYFRGDGKARVDALLSPMGFSLALYDPPAAKALAELDAPVLQMIVTSHSQKVWAESEQAVAPIEVSVLVAQPEFDGCLIGPVAGAREELGIDEATGAMRTGQRPVAERCAHVARWAVNWARLRRTPPAERKIAILFHHYPPKNDRLGCASGLDSFESVKRLCERLEAEGHGLARRYRDGEDLAFELLDRLTNDRRYLPPQHMAERAAAIIEQNIAERWHAERSDRMRKEMAAKWGPPPGFTFAHKGGLLVGGVVNGNVFIGMQPTRACMEAEDEPTIQADGSALHDPYLPATHHYLGYYRWLRDVFGAQAVYHIGTHGSLEWLPGKSVGLSRDCYPDAAIADLPNLYPYIVSNPGEGTQAKRRGYACILDHMIPPQTNAGATEPIQAIEDLLDKVHIARQEDPSKLSVLIDSLWEKAEALHLDRDLGLGKAETEADPTGFCTRLHGYLHEVEVTAINDGLHVFGQPPADGRFNETLLHLTRLPNGDAPSLWDTVATAFGHEGADLRDNPGQRDERDGRTKGQILGGLLDEIRACFSNFDRLGWTEENIVAQTQQRFCGSPRVAKTLRFVMTTVRPALQGVTDELDHAVKGVEGRFVPPGPSGAPTRGNVGVMPTGRNFYSVDPYKIPTPEAWAVGVRLGDALVERYRADEGRDPQQLGMTLWATPTMRTGGDDVAEIFYLMGVRPVWADNGKVKGVEPIPLHELKFPRLDVTVRGSGMLRDAFPNVMALIDSAVRMVAALNEPDDVNFLGRNVARDRAELIKAGLSPEAAARRAGFRLFAEKPGCYGAGVSDLLESGRWRDIGDLGDLYIHWGGYAYGADAYGEALQQDFRQRLSRLDLTVMNADTREYDIFSSDDFNAYHGGMNAAVKRTSGRYARSYSGDSNDPRKPRIRATDEEGRFIFRTRILNPKWIAGMKRHGYKGAGDLAEAVDYCFQWDATSDLLEDWQYAEMARTYAFDPAMQDFFRKHNPYALQSIAERLLEAIRRGQWQNPGADEQALETLFLEAEGEIEDSLAGSIRAAQQSETLS
ncbi:cobaltochelatase CobN [Rhodoblastus acidophilus]|nr:cobaltochelatase subunit CobN [Rhodoblastus acidophilus]MCW2274814.1 cobaltochelatase CobN [Rhodoblastus acidophilus]